MAIITLYWNERLQGPNMTCSASNPNLHLDNFGDRLTSFTITSGQWKLFQDIDYGGLSWGPFGPGTYLDVRDFGIPDDFISSILVVAES